MSLSYHFDHNCWKQRVGKEQTASNNFFDSVRTWSASIKPGHTSRSFGKSDMQRSANLKNMHQTSSSRLSKYPITLNHALENYFDEDNYKNANVNPAYSFGGTKRASNAFKWTPKYLSQVNGQRVPIRDHYGHQTPLSGHTTPRLHQSSRASLAKSKSSAGILVRPVTAGSLHSKNSAVSASRKSECYSKVHVQEIAYGTPIKTSRSSKASSRLSNRLRSPVPKLESKSQQRFQTYDLASPTNVQPMKPSSSQKSAKARVFEERLKRITDYEESKNSRSRSESNHSQPEQISDEEDGPAQLPEEEIRVDLDYNELVSRPQTASTWRTSASQKLYIESLEKMLKEERARRIQIQGKIDEEVYGNP